MVDSFRSEDAGTELGEIRLAGCRSPPDGERPPRYLIQSTQTHREHHRIREQQDTGAAHDDVEQRLAKLDRTIHSLRRYGS
jgi:hypothetical protein